MAKGKQSKGKPDDNRVQEPSEIRVTCSNCSHGTIKVDVAGGTQEQDCPICDGNGWYWGPPA